MSDRAKASIAVIVGALASVALALFIRLYHYGDWSQAIIVSGSIFNGAIALALLNRKRRSAK